MGITVSILIFERKSKSFFVPKYSLQTVGEKHLASEIIEAASNALPKGFKPNMYKASQDNKPASVRFFSQDKKITAIASSKPLNSFTLIYCLKITAAGQS